MDIDKIDYIIEKLKEISKNRGDNIDEYEEHEVDIEREEFYKYNRFIDFHTDNTAITIFYLINRFLGYCCYNDSY